MSIKNFEVVIKNLPTKKIAGLSGFTVAFYQMQMKNSNLYKPTNKWAGHIFQLILLDHHKPNTKTWQIWIMKEQHQHRLKNTYKKLPNLIQQDTTTTICQDIDFFLRKTK